MILLGLLGVVVDELFDAGLYKLDLGEDDSDYAGTMTMTWEVKATDDGTRVDIRAADVPSGISAEDHAARLASSLANLAAHVER